MGSVCEMYFNKSTLNVIYFQEMREMGWDRLLGSGWMLTTQWVLAVEGCPNNDFSSITTVLVLVYFVYDYGL